MKELEKQKKKIALKRLEAAINTFFEDKCVLQLTENGNVVHIKFTDGSTQGIIIRDYAGIQMLYDVLKYGFIGVKGE